MRRRDRGFTLVELMTVVIIIGALAGMAVVAFRKGINANRVAGLARQLKDGATTCSRRAIATRAPYMFEVKALTSQCCAVDPTTISATYTSTQTTCVGLAATNESLPISRAPGDTNVAYYTNVSDVLDINTGSYSAPAKSGISTGAVFYFGANGTAGSTLAGVMAAGGPPPGFSLYVRPKTFDDAFEKHQRIVVYGASSKARIIDNYN